MVRKGTGAGVKMSEQAVKQQSVCAPAQPSTEDHTAKHTNCHLKMANLRCWYMNNGRCSHVFDGPAANQLPLTPCLPSTAHPHNVLHVTCCVWFCTVVVTCVPTFQHKLAYIEVHKQPQPQAQCRCDATRLRNCKCMRITVARAWNNYTRLRQHNRVRPSRKEPSTLLCHGGQVASTQHSCKQE
jgi:hypothetical protein